MPIATALACIVIGIADGDTLTARCDSPEGKVNITVRLAEVDAPERGQPWGNRSKQHLAGMCFKKQSEVRPQTTDRYGRTVARVECDGVDASTEQVRTGMAWVFDRYVTPTACCTRCRMRRGKRSEVCGLIGNRCRRGSGAAQMQWDSGISQLTPPKVGGKVSPFR